MKMNNKNLYELYLQKKAEKEEHEKSELEQFRTHEFYQTNISRLYDEILKGKGGINIEVTKVNYKLIQKLYKLLHFDGFDVYWDQCDVFVLGVKDPNDK